MARKSSSNLKKLPEINKQHSHRYHDAVIILCLFFLQRKQRKHFEAKKERKTKDIKTHRVREKESENVTQHECEGETERDCNHYDTS